jgi:hypothetical protein
MGGNAMTFLDGFLPALGLLTACGVAFMVFRFWKVSLGIVVLLAVAAAGTWGYIAYTEAHKPIGRNFLADITPEAGHISPCRFRREAGRHSDYRPVSIPI